MVDYYKLSLIFYRAILIIITPFLFIAKIFTGYGGHSSSDLSQNTFFIISILSIITLTIFIKYENLKFQNLLRFLNIILISIGVLSLFYSIYDSIFILREDFNFGDLFTLFILLLFLLISSTLLIGLVKNKIHDF